MIKNLMFAISIMALLSLVGCNDDKQLSNLKNVTYEAAFNTYPGDSELILKGEYIDQYGNKILVDNPLPFKVELKDVPVKIQTGFKGYIYSAKATVVKGKFYYSVKSVPDGSNFLKSEKDINISKNTGFTSEELKLLTTFEF